MASQDPIAARAARLSRVPGVTIAEACERFGVTRAAVERARREVRSLTLEELAMAALTRNGEREAGELDLAGIAAWLDYVNHDGSTAEDARRLLDGVVARGQLAIDGSAWRLLEPWP
jgi:transposase-like protein